MPAFPSGFPTFPQVQQQGYGYQQPYAQPYYPPMPPPPMVGTPQYAMWSAEADKRTESAELRALRDENQRREREAIEARHKAELERDRQATEARFAAQNNSMTELRNLITSLTTAISNQQNTRKPDDAVEALKLQIQQQQQQAEADRREREQERRERETRDMIKSMQDASQKQIDAMMRQLDAFQQSLTAINANKSDPMIEMLREQSRQSAEAMKAVAASHAASIDKMQSSMMHPRDILQVAREASSQADQVTDKLTTSFGRVIDLQAKVTENALQMQPQGSPIVDMVRDGAGNLKEMAERYFSKVELQQRLQAEQQNQLLQAQRDVQIAQIHAQNPGLAGLQQQQHQIEAAQQQSMNGHVNHQTPKKKKPKAGDKPIVDASGQPIKARKILGKTDQEWFGPITNEINQLREGVAEYLESLKLNRADERGQPIGISAEQTAQSIAQGTMMVVQMGVEIQAMKVLLFEQRFAEFMEVVLPDAPEQFRADVIQMLVPLLRGEVGGGPGMTGEPKEEATAENEGGESNEDDDDDDDAGDDADTDPHDGNDATNDGAESPARGHQEAKAAPVSVPVLRSIGPNGKPTNPPRRT